MQQLFQLATDVATIPQPPSGDQMPKTAETVFNIIDQFKALISPSTLTDAPVLAPSR